MSIVKLCFRFHIFIVMECWLLLLNYVMAIFNYLWPMSERYHWNLQSYRADITMTTITTTNNNVGFSVLWYDNWYGKYVEYFLNFKNNILKVSELHLCSSKLYSHNTSIEVSKQFCLTELKIYFVWSHTEYDNLKSFFYNKKKQLYRWSGTTFQNVSSVATFAKMTFHVSI